MRNDLRRQAKQKLHYVNTTNIDGIYSKMTY